MFVRSLPPFTAAEAVPDDLLSVEPELEPDFPAPALGTCGPVVHEPDCTEWSRPDSNGRLRLFRPVLLHLSYGTEGVAQLPLQRRVRLPVSPSPHEWGEEDSNLQS